MSRKQNKSEKSGLGRLLFTVLLLAIVAATLAYYRSRSAASSLAHIRELGQQNPEAAIQLLDEQLDRSRDSGLLRCQLLAMSGRWEQAEREFDELGEPELCGQDELIELASLALGAGIFSLADKVLDAAYRHGVHDPELLRTMVDLKHRLGFDQEALPLCHELSQLNPRDPYPWLLSARIYHDAEKIDLAIGAYREAILRDIDERDARRVRIQIADLAIYAGDLETAGQQLERLVAEFPTDPDVGLLNARLLHHQGNFAASLRALDAVLASRPDLVSALLERGVLYLERENFADAVRDLKQVVTLAPENYTGHYQLGLAYQRLNQPDLAKRHLEQSARITERISADKLQAEQRRRTKVRTSTN